MSEKFEEKKKSNFLSKKKLFALFLVGSEINVSSASCHKVRWVSDIRADINFPVFEVGDKIFEPCSNFFLTFHFSIL